MATKQELEQELKQVKEELAESLAFNEQLVSPEEAAYSRAQHMKNIELRLGELGQMSLKESEKRVLRSYYAGITIKLKAEHDYIMKKFDGGK